MILVDTNVWSEAMKPSPDPRVMAWLGEHSADAAISTLTIGELLAGVAVLPDGRRREALRSLIDRLVVGARARTFAYDEHAARAFAAITSERGAAGRPYGNPVDAMIAAVARANEMPIATRNIRDFEHAGVDAVDPWQEPIS
ncbi:MAG: type II toxin-antitoxin system VapC family toxin [Nocardioidaceae bacterium]|nr:type II toxin-antitoxin system VapC family toxin [Nocardioidaceae bacterium]MCL2612562.1 type II toxin-antitoxin system VapC family toxin [Nocardioidaceae bacterium]